MCENDARGAGISPDDRRFKGKEAASKGKKDAEMVRRGSTICSPRFYAVIDTALIEAQCTQYLREQYLGFALTQFAHGQLALPGARCLACCRGAGRLVALVLRHPRARLESCARGGLAETSPTSKILCARRSYS